MLYNEFLRLKYHVKTKACFILLFFYMMLLSVLLVKAIPQMVTLYNSVGLTYKIENFFFGLDITVSFLFPPSGYYFF